MFRRRVVSLTVALGLHGVGGWLLSSAAPDVAARGALSQSTLVWLEAPADGPSAVGASAEPPQLGSAPRQPAPVRGAPTAGTSRSRAGAGPRSVSKPLPPKAAPSRPEVAGRSAASGHADPRGSEPEPVATERRAHAALGVAFGAGAATPQAPESGLLSRGAARSTGGMSEEDGYLWGRGAHAAAHQSASPPHLVGRGNPCADLFPHSANSDSGVVEVALRVAVSGQPLDSQIVDEVPRDQGFALAARHCVRRLRFAPALDGSGHAVASRSVVRLRFERHSPTASRAL